MTFGMKFLKRRETLSNISIRKEGNEYHLINPFLHNAKGYVSFISNQTVQNLLLITNIQWMGTNVPFSQQVDSNIFQSTTPTKPPGLDFYKRKGHFGFKGQSTKIKYTECGRD